MINEPVVNETNVRDSLRSWGIDLDTFRTKANASVEAAKGDLSEVTGVLRQTLTDTKSILLDMQKSREPIAAEIKGGFERAWDEIEKAFGRARQLLRESRSAAPVTTVDDSYWLG